MPAAHSTLTFTESGLLHRNMYSPGCVFRCCSNEGTMLVGYENIPKNKNKTFLMDGDSD